MWRPQPVPWVSAQDVPDDAYLLDVREDDEWMAGHAPGAHHVPMMEVPARLADVPTDADVVVVCRMGGRSAQVVTYLSKQGWDNVRNLEGGMEAWQSAGRPMVSEDGQPARVV
ncbi:rhodanese-like domain-containing protein [Asanoa iriomotensis]|uniref:rhodanese-like domain-containing protein n=1 Tax=Asanoa iriomotensis TaxID=234613 RepID=UPI001940CCAE|nr:rhodanese-like domain-containing protein [Asanoa iriomotensis]